MNDIYQPTYDAVRSRLYNGDIGMAVSEVMRECRFDLAAQALHEMATNFQMCHSAPSAVYRPRLFLDGDMWCALYGDNLQDGVAGFGKSPGAAMMSFDVEWVTAISEPEGT